MIGWWCRRRKLSVAGIRIRAHLVMRELRRQGVAVEWFDPARPDRYRTVILHKHYDKNARAVAETLKRAGTRVVFDLCDNHFYNPARLPQWTRNAANLRCMAELADQVVVSTAALGEVVAAECRLPSAPVVIPDAVDTLADVPVPVKTRLALLLPGLILRRRIRAAVAAGRLPLLWFGNHGTEYADGGMLDLLPLRQALELLDRRLPLHLTVLSNNREKFEAHFRDWSFPVHYGTWSAHQFDATARLHAIALIPAQNNPFTRVKSENRVVTAFAHGLAVVADPVPSYHAFSDTLCFGDWATGIERYARDPALRDAHARAGKQRADALFGMAQVAKQWRQILGT